MVHRLGSKASHGHCLGSLVMKTRSYTQQLIKTAGLAPCLGGPLNFPGVCGHNSNRGQDFEAILE